MQKSKNSTIVILIVMFLYFLFSQFYLKTLGNVYVYIINPIFFVMMAIFLKFIIEPNYVINKYKKTIMQYVLITILFYAFIYLLSGIFLTYGKNPYNSSIKGILLNLYSIGLVIFCREYIRYKLINNVIKKDKKLIFALIVMTFIFQDMITVSLQDNFNAYYIFKIIFMTLIPSIIKNCLFTYIENYTNYIPVVLYEIFLCLLQWIPPVLPNAPWIFTSIIDILFPLVLLVYCIYEVSSKDKLHIYKAIKTVKPTGLIPLSIGIVLVIWFTIGIFPVKPVGVGSGSMEPELNVGDLILVHKSSVNDIEEGDIIQYKKDDISVIHRVIKKVTENGVTYFNTKGDNNYSQDDDPVYEEQLEGKIIFKIPYLALPTVWINNLSRQNVNANI